MLVNAYKMADLRYQQEKKQQNIKLEIAIFGQEEKRITKWN